LGLYRLDQQVGHDGATTYLGVLEASNSPVMIHVINSTERVTLEALFNRLKSTGSSGIVDVQTEGGYVYAVTRVIPGFAGFSAWLERAMNESPPPAESMPDWNPDTIDRKIASLEAPAAGPAANPPEKRIDEVADMFARPVSATQMRGRKDPPQDRNRQGKRSFEPPPPGPYTIAIEGHRPVNMPAPTPTAQRDPGSREHGGQPLISPSNPPPPDPALLQRITRLETELGKWKMFVIATMAVALVTLILMFGLVIRVK